MALVKMVRNAPETEGGNTEGMFPEETVADLKKRGWNVADKGSEKKAEPAKEQPKAEPKEPKEPKVEPKVEEPKAPKFEEKKEEFGYSKK